MVYKNYEEYIAKTGGSQLSKEKFDQIIKEKQEQELADSLIQGRIDKAEQKLGTIGGDNYLKRQDSMDSISNPLSNNDNLRQSLLQPSITNQQKPTIDSMLENQKQARVNTAKTGLQATRENVLSSLANKKAEIDPRIAQSRASAVSGTAIAQKRLSDLIPFSGGMAGQQVSRGEQLNADLQNRQSELDVQREQSFKDVATQEADTERAYQQGLTLAESQAQEQYLSGQLDNARTQEERAYAQQQIQSNRDYESQLRQQAIQREDELIQQGYTREDAQLQAKLERDAKANQESKAERDAAQNRIDFAATINPKEDLTAKLNELEKQGVPQDDYRVIELKKAKINKIASMNQANFEIELANIKSVDEQQEAALAFAWKKFSAGLPADPVTARLLGVGVGQIIPEQRIRDAQLKLDQNRASKASLSGSGATEKQKSADDYKAFEADLRNLLLSDPAKATNLVKANREELIRQKGLNVYNSLLAQAEKLTLENLNKFKNSQYNFIPQP